MDDQGKNSTNLALMLGTLKAVAWPVVILFVTIAFWGPLHKIADRFSPLVDNITSVTVGGVQFTVTKEFIQKRAPEAVRIAVAKLTPEAIRYILENERGVKRTTRRDLSGEERELIAGGLCTEMNYKDLAQAKRDNPMDKRDYQAGFDCGSKYEDVRVFLLELVPELVKKAST